MKMNKVIGTLLAVSMLSVTPAWAAETKPKTPSKPVYQVPDADELPKAVLDSIERLTKKFPQLKGYDMIEVEDVVQNVVELALLKRDQGSAKVDPDGEVRDLILLCEIELDMTTGEVKHFSFNGKRDFSSEKPEKEIKAKATVYLNELLDENAADYQMLSVWHMEKMELGQKKRMYSQINYKGPVNKDAGKADYVEIMVQNNGDFMSYNKKTLPVAYDSWYDAELDERVKPNDELPGDAKTSLAKVKEIFPIMNNYPVEEIVAGDDGSAKIYLKKDKENTYPGVYMKFAANGEIVSLLIAEPNMNKPAANDAAKEIAASFLKTYLGDGAKNYKIAEVKPSTHTLNLPNGKIEQTLARVTFTSADASKKIHIEVASTGDVCGIYLN